MLIVLKNRSPVLTETHGIRIADEFSARGQLVAAQKWVETTTIDGSATRTQPIPAINKSVFLDHVKRHLRPAIIACQTHEAAAEIGAGVAPAHLPAKIKAVYSSADTADINKLEHLFATNLQGKIEGDILPLHEAIHAQDTSHEPAIENRRSSSEFPLTRIRWQEDKNSAKRGFWGESLSRNGMHCLEIANEQTPWLCSISRDRISDAYVGLVLIALERCHKATNTISLGAPIATSDYGLMMLETAVIDGDTLWEDGAFTKDALPYLKSAFELIDQRLTGYIAHTTGVQNSTASNSEQCSRYCQNRMRQSGPPETETPFDCSFNFLGGHLDRFFQNQPQPAQPKEC